MNIFNAYFSVSVLSIALFAFSTSVAAETFSHIAIHAKNPQSVLLFSPNQNDFQCKPITCSSLKKVGAEIVFYSTDTESLEKRWSEGLSSDPEIAKKQFKAKLAAKRKDEFIHALINSYQARLLAQRMNIKKTPAIVFDHEWVVYGITDIDEAINHYRNERLNRVGDLK